MNVLARGAAIAFQTIEMIDRGRKSVAGDIRRAILEVIERNAHDSLQSGSVLSAAFAALQMSRGRENEQLFLTEFHELFRIGYLSWGLDFANSKPPFFHVTEQGRRTLAKLSSDPGNPAGYMLRLKASGPINSIAEAYISEALACFVADLNKASAVMIGGASESLALELRDAAVTKLENLGRVPPKDLKDWRMVRVLGALKSIFEGNRSSIQRSLYENFEANWPAFTQQIRAARNEAGHPSSVSPVTSSTVHASLLIFPELMRLSLQLKKWIVDELA